MPDNSNLWSQVLSDPNQAAMQPETFSNPLVKQKIEHMAQVLAAPGQALQSEKPVTTEDLLAPTRDMAMQFGMLGVPMAKPGTAGIFGGKLAKTANLDKLAQAERMAGKGQTPEMIRDITGWHQGPDAQWRFEIPDDRSRLMFPGGNNPTSYAKAAAPIEHMLAHPELYKAYPQLRDVNASVELDPSFKSPSGLWSPTSKTIEMSTHSGADARLGLLHELQHGVQHLEGFTPGTTVQAYEHIQKTAPEAWKQAEQVVGKKLTPYDTYHNTAGEVESRNVENRADYNADARRAILPWSSQDVPTKQQLRVPAIPADHPIIRALRGQ